MNDHSNPSRRYPAITGDNIVLGIATGATTRPMLADMFGVRDDDTRLKLVIRSLALRGRIRMAPNDAHTLSLVPGQAV